MIVDIAWWELGPSDPGVSDLRADLGDGSVAAWTDVAGLALKLWLADPPGRRWGAVMVWASEPPDGCALPANRAAALIGRPADRRMRCVVQAAAGTLAAVASSAGSRR
jgi:hypothetical protein